MPARYGVGTSGGATAGTAQGSKRAKGAADEAMLVDQQISVPVQKVSHLSQLVVPKRVAGCRVLRVTSLENCPSFAAARDLTRLTPTAPGGQYVRLNLGGKTVNALYDTGSNCTVISQTLAQQLGLPVQAYSAQFK